MRANTGPLGPLHLDASTRRPCSAAGPSSLRVLSSVAVLLLLVLTSDQVAAATYYVDPQTGSDTNGGTVSSAPWETVPGTRTRDNSGFLRSQWGGVSQSNKIKCGDTIFLKGGTTYSPGTVNNGGAWRIDPSYYTSTCTAAAPITIRVATNPQWSGSTGHFTVDGTGMTTTSAGMGATGACSTGGACALIDIEAVSGVVFGGIADGQRLRVVAVKPNANAVTDAVLFFGDPVRSRHIQLGWLDLTGKSAYDAGAAIGVGQVDDSWIHDVLIHDWLGSGINVGLETGHRRARGLVIEDTTVTNTGNMTSSSYLVADPFRFGGAEYSDANAGGGVWCIRCVTGNGLSSGTNSFGCLSGGEDGLLRFRDSVFYGMGRNTQIVNGASIESAGDGENCFNGTRDNLPTQTVMLIRSVIYNNRQGSGTPHNGGTMYHWHSTFYREPIALNVCAESMGFFNTIIDTGSRVDMPAMWYVGCGADHNATAPVFSNTFVRGTASANRLTDFMTECTADNRATWTGAGCRNGSCPSGQTCRMRFGGGTTFASPVRALVSNGNVVGMTSPGFVSTGGGCDTSWDSSGAPGYPACNFRLSASSPAVDPPTPLFVLLANGAGTNATTIAVKASTPEPEQLSGAAPYRTLWGGSNYGFNYTARPHIADPRTYFLSPQNHPWATGDVVQIVGTCTNGAARHGAAGRARIMRMTSSTITLDDTCTWANNAGIHWPFNGTGPDMGAYESGFTGQSVSAPHLISVEPL